MISSSSFIAWEKSTDSAEQAGKGVALKSLTTFFTALCEADEDSSCEESWARLHVVAGTNVLEKELWACDAPYTNLWHTVLFDVCLPIFSLTFLLLKMKTWAGLKWFFQKNTKVKE